MVPSGRAKKLDGGNPKYSRGDQLFTQYTSDGKWLYNLKQEN